MKQEYKKIPIINDTFDPNSFVYIIKQNIALYVIILVIALVGAFVFLRYSAPLYDASVIIQINKTSEDMQAVMLRNTMDDVLEQNLSSLVELLRSPEFKKRSLKKLPLNINYFSEGTFLNYEQYTSNPYFVELRNTKGFFYNIPIYVRFKNETTYELTYIIENEKNVYELKTNKWNTIKGTDIYLNVSNYQKIVEYQRFLTGKSYYFIPYDDNGALNANFSSIDIRILDEASSTIVLEYWGQNPQKAADILNLLIQDFLDYNIEKKQEHANKILEFIDQQLKVIYKSLDESERNLSEFKRNNHIKEDVFLLTSDKFLNNSNSDDKTEKIRQEYEALIKVKDQISSNNEINTAQLMSLLSNTPSESMITNYLNAISQLQNERNKLLINVTEKNQKIVTIDKQIAIQKELLSEFVNITNQKLQSEIKSMQQQAKMNGRPIDSTGKKIREYDEVELSKLTRTYKIHEGFYFQLIDMKAKYMVAKAGHVSSNLVLRKAEPPGSPIYPVRSKIFAIFFAIGVVLVVLITAIKYLLHNDITTLSDITKYTDAPISGVIPTTRRASISTRRLLVENKPDSIFTEAFRTFRSNLEFLSSKKGSKIIAVSSTISGEGKTFVALNLGGVLSFSGKKVVILDMDLRRPKIHLNFNAENNAGMSTLLIGRDSLEECIQHTDFKSYDFITSGPIPPNPSELATSDAFEQLLEKLKETYDYVIIDTPPIGIVSDAIYSFQKADYPLYVTRVNFSKKNFIYNLNYLKESKEIPNLSVVLNGVGVRSSKYGYGYKNNYNAYGYSYGYSYGYTYGYSYNHYSSKNDIDVRPQGIFRYLKYLNIFYYLNSDKDQA